MEEINVMGEIWRYWVGDLKPHFTAEAEFLQKYGVEAGYGTGYIARVLDDHRLLEKLVWKDGQETALEFARLLSAHIRYKEDYFLERVRHLVEAGRNGGLPAGLAQQG
jgi:hypothetical protein